MKNPKRTLAILGIAFLVLLYASTLIFAFIDWTASLVLFKVTLGASFFFPVIFYIISVVAKLGQNNQDIPDDMKQDTSNDSDLY